VRLGGILATDPEPDAVYANVLRVIIHPYYRSTGHVHDIGLLHLTSPVTYTDTILPICLPSANVNLDQFKVCVNTGFGRTAYTRLFLFVHFMWLQATTSHASILVFRPDFCPVYVSIRPFW